MSQPRPQRGFGGGMRQGGGRGPSPRVRPN
jgi:hypothetical protein